MNFIKTMRQIADMNGNIIDNKTAAKYGISRAMLSKMYKENKIQRLRYGQYIFDGDIPDEFLSITLRFDQVVLSHETALFLHGLADKPQKNTFTSRSGKVPTKAVQSEYNIHYIKPALFDLGKTTLTTPGGCEVTAYDLERTVCDLIRSRNTIDSNIFTNALQAYAKKPEKDLNKLFRYAEEMRMAGVTHRYIDNLV